MATQVRDVNDTPRNVGSTLSLTYDSGEITRTGIDTLTLGAGAFTFTDLLDTRFFITQTASFGGSLLKTRQALTAVTLTFKVTITAIANLSIAIYYSDTLPATQSDGTQVGATVPVFSGVEATITTGTIPTAPLARYYWLAHTEITSQSNRGTGDSVTFQIEATGTVTDSVVLVVGQRYQVWNNGPGEVYIAHSGALPDGVDGTIIRQCEHYEFIKVSGENLYIWSGYSKARVAVQEA